MHELRSRRRGHLSTNAGLTLALGACLCAGQLIGTNTTTAAPAPAVAAPVAAAPFTAAATPQTVRYELVASTTSVQQARRNKILAIAKKLSGSRYRYGASGPRVFDCSGFTMYVYRKAVGRKLPHKANLQQRYGHSVPRSQAKPGDLIIFRSGSYGYHAAIYAGGGYMYDSPRPGKKVGKHKIWSRNYVVRRLV